MPEASTVILRRWTRDLEQRNLVVAAALLASWALWSDERAPASASAVGRALAAAGSVPVITRVAGRNTRAWTLPSHMTPPAKVRDLEERMTALERAVAALRGAK